MFKFCYNCTEDHFRLFPQNVMDFFFFNVTMERLQSTNQGWIPIQAPIQR